MSECKQDTYIFLFENAHERLSVINIALQKCSKYFKDYEVAEVTQITQQELDNVSQAFKVLIQELEKITVKNE